MAPLLEPPPPVHRYAPGTWGRRRPIGCLRGFGRWHAPWVAS